MKAEILEGMAKGRLGFGPFIRLVFFRVLRVIAVCLALTLIVWLVWLGKFTFGAFFAGAAVGFSVFLIIRWLRRCWADKQPKERPDEAVELGDLPNPEEARSRSQVED